MFGDSLLEVSSAQRLRKSGLTAFSMGLQAVLVLCLLTLPLLKPERIAIMRTVPSVSFLGEPQPLHPAEALAGGGHAGTMSIAVQHRFSFRPTAGGETTEPAAPCLICPTVGTGSGDTGIPISILGSGPAMPVAQPHADHPPRISHQMGGNLIYRVQPVYPPLAKTAHIEGVVELHAIISREGRVEYLHLVSGHPLLSQAAIDALRQWRYKPYVLNGEAMEVETEVTVNFYLNRAP